MAKVTGDRDAVRKLMEDTVREIAASARVTAGRKKATAAALAKKGQVANVADVWRQALSRIDGPSEGRARAAGIKPQAPAGGRAVATSYAPRDQMIAVFQSAMDEYLDQKAIGPAPAPGGPGKPGGARSASLRSAAVQPAEAEGLDAFYSRKARGGPRAADVFARFGNLDPRWTEVVVQKTKALLKGKHPFIQHAAPTDFRFPMAGTATIAVVGDWGGGNRAAQEVAKQIQKLAPDHVIHLGDVYYAGTPKEVRERFLKYWPAPASPGRSFALNSNHEMYSGGYGYFDLTLKTFKQPASYFNLANGDWQLIGLDTGYDEHDLHEPQVEWLRKQLDDAGTRKTLLLSHHQLFSAYEKTDASKLDAKVSPLLSKVYGWIWGHEHLAVVYQPHRDIRAVCLGNGCFPYDFPKAEPSMPVEWIDTHRVQDPDYPGGHTFALMKLDGPRIDVDFIDENGVVQHQAKWG